MTQTLPARADAPTWASAARSVLPHLGALVGVLLVLAGWKGGGSVPVTVGAVLGVVALAGATVALSRTDDRQRVERAAWLVGARRALALPHPRYA